MMSAGLALGSEELVVEAHFEDMLVGTHVLSLVKGERITKRRAGYGERNVFRTKTQIIVFELGRPVIEEGIFQTETDQQTIQRGVGSRGGAKVAAVYIGRVPVKPAGYPSRLAVNKCPVKGDAKSPGNVIIPSVSDAGGFSQGTAIYPINRSMVIFIPDQKPSPSMPRTSMPIW